MSQFTVWTALTVVGVIACLSSFLGILLYNYSTAVFKSKAMRLSGATAIAWVLFLGLSKFYITVSTDLQTQTNHSISEKTTDVAVAAKNYGDCSLQVGDFKCKIPADRLHQSCEKLVKSLK